MTKYSNEFQTLDSGPVCNSCNNVNIPTDNYSNKPVFAGKKQLAYLNDLEALHDAIIQWLVGPSGEFSENGYAPLNASGTIDTKYFSQVGVNTYQNNTIIKPNATNYNFHGNYVYTTNKTVLDNNNNTIEMTDIYVGEPVNASDIGTSNGITDGSIIFNTELTEMIVPNTNGADFKKIVYGDWEAGTVVSGFNSLELSTLILSSKEPIRFADKNSTFVLTIFGPDGIAKSKVESGIISGNSDNVPLVGANQNMLFQVTDFTEKGFEYEANIIWSINLADELGIYGGRFSLMIVHKQTNQKLIWKSIDLLYNTGNLPTAGGINEQIVTTLNNDLTYQPEYIYASGIKYLKSGKIKISVSDINNLMTNAGVSTKVSIDNDLINCDDYVYSDDDLENYTSGLIDTNVKWLHQFDINENLLNITPSALNIDISNAVGTISIQKDIKILINSLSGISSTNLIENFINENYRQKNDFGIDEWNSRESLETFDDGYGLMVIPGYGLCYPNKYNFSEYLPENNPNYQMLTGIKYFCRKFYANDDNKRFGGTFCFKGITISDFMSNNISCNISKDNGTNWLNLKTYRDSDDISGIYCEGRDIIDGCEIQFAFNKDEYVSGQTGILFKLGFNSIVNNLCIKQIKLNNITNTDLW